MFQNLSRVFIILYLTFVSCKTSDFNKSSNALDISPCLSSLNVNHQIPYDNIPTSVKYLDLHFQDSKVLVSRIEQLKIDHNYIMIADQSNQLYLFDTSGFFIRKIGHQSGGEGEYNLIISADIDYDNNLVIIWDSSRQKLYRYRLDNGEPINEIKIKSFAIKVFIINSDKYLFYSPFPFNLPDLNQLFIIDHQGNTQYSGIPGPKPNAEAKNIRGSLPVTITRSDDKFYIHESLNSKVYEYDIVNNNSKLIFNYTFDDQPKIDPETALENERLKIDGFISQCIPLNNEMIYLKGIKENKVISCLYNITNSVCYSTSTSQDAFEIFQNPLEPAGNRALFDLLVYGQYHSILNNTGKLNQTKLIPSGQRAFDQIIRIINY